MRRHVRAGAADIGIILKRRALMGGSLAWLACAAAESAFGRSPEQVPVAGPRSYGMELLDQVMLGYLNRIGCTAAALAVSRKGLLAHSRGYGWSDRNRTQPTQADTMIGIASCEKPITAAAVRQLARNGQLNLDTPLFALLRLEPRAQVTDTPSRITIRHLLEHKWLAGRAARTCIAAARNQGHRDPIGVETLLGYLMAQKLREAPGSRSDYCNFCYDTLRHVLARVSGMSAVDVFRRVLFRPHGIGDLRGFEAPHAAQRSGDPPLVWNDGGPVSASAPALCTFMRYYWLTGEPRERGNPLWQMNGSLPGSTALMLWRPDGTDLAFIFNGRGNANHDEIKRDLEGVLPRVA
jgi:CubicO group peptidase (beta-lactamase class C family)